MGHGIHSPFVYNFYIGVLNAPINKSDKTYLKKVLQRYKKDRYLIHCPPIGAGSVYKQNQKITVGKFIKNSSIKYRYGRVLYKLAEYFKPGVILELGTGLGLSTFYLALGNTYAKIYTIEACTNKANYAKEQFKKYNLENIELLNEPFENGISRAIEDSGKFDLVFMDGDHSFEKTIQYFNVVLNFSHNNTVLVIDDIYWSEGMKKAWNYIQSSEKVRVTIDLFQLGIVFFKKELSKQNFMIKY